VDRTPICRFTIKDRQADSFFVIEGELHAMLAGTR
jgi:hypothetical protein